MRNLKQLAEEAHKIYQLRESSLPGQYYKDIEDAIDKLYIIARKINQDELIDQTKYQQLKIKISNVKLYFDSIL